MNNRTYPSILFVISFVCYSLSLFNGFALDDLIQIVNNQELKDLNLKALLLEGSYPGNLYRPVVFLNYLINFILFDLNPFSYHFINVLFHSINSVLVFYFLNNLTKRKLAFYSGLLFSVHPIHVEAVANISGSAEVLSTFFLLSLLIIKPKNLLLSFILSLLAFLTKESSYIVLLIIPLINLFIKKEGFLKSFLNKQIYIIFLSCLISLCFRYLALDGLALSTYINYLDNPLINLDSIDRAVFSIILLAKYINLHVLPLVLTSDYSFNYIGIENLFLDFIIFPVLALIVFFSLVKSKKDIIYIILFLISFLITSNIFFPIGTVFAERLCYFPSIFLITFIILVFNNLLSEKINSVAIPIIAFIFLLISMNYSLVWKDNSTLYNYQIQTSANSAKTQFNYAQLQQDLKNYDQALIHFDKAIEIYPNFNKVNIAKGDTYFLMSEYRKSYEFYLKAYSMEPSTELDLALGKVLFNLNSMEESRKYFENVLNQEFNYEAKLGLAFIFYKTNNSGKALKTLNELLELNPNDQNIKSFINKIKSN